jgi:hypothetical protein
MMPQSGTAETLDLHGLPVTDQVVAMGLQPLGGCRDLYHFKATDTVRVMPRWCHSRRAAETVDGPRETTETKRGSDSPAAKSCGTHVEIDSTDGLRVVAMVPQFQAAETPPLLFPVEGRDGPQ